jgi:hypothetical protein
LLDKRPDQIWLAIGFVSIMAVAMNLSIYGFLFSQSAYILIGVPLVMFVSPRLSNYFPRLPGTVFYGFYPVHLGIIYLVHGPYAA